MKNIIEQVRAIVAEAENMRNAYFHTPPAAAAGRRRYEEQHSHDRVEWAEGGHSYAAEFFVACSCNNVYARGAYEKDGKKTTLTAIRNSLERLERGVA